MSTPQSKGKGRGCLFYGVIVALVLFVLVMVGLFFVYRFVKNSYQTLVAQYTDTNAVAIQVVELPPERLEAIQTRVDNFKQALEDQQTREELVLTAEEINGLIGGDPEAGELKEHLFVRIQDGRISGDVSIPLGDIGLPGLDNRYLNGQASFRVALTNNQLWISIDDLEVNGKPLPSMLQKELQNRNLAQELRQDPETEAMLQKLDSIVVQEDKLILRTRGPPATEAATPTP